MRDGAIIAQIDVRDITDLLDALVGISDPTLQRCRSTALSVWPAPTPRSTASTSWRTRWTDGRRDVWTRDGKRRRSQPRLQLSEWARVSRGDGGGWSPFRRPLPT